MSEHARAVPRPRTIVHPGPRDDLRIDHVHAAQGRHFRLSLAPGRSLHDALVDVLASVDVRCAAMTLLDGELDALSFCIGGPDRSGRTVAAYGPPVESRRARLLFGNATLGRSMSDEPLVHGHAVFRLDDDSVRGGHVLCDRTIVGREPITVLATELAGMALRLSYDAETCMPLLRPKLEPTHG
jgi:predicted DNA-binding protein with PD1-like motif